MRFYDVDKETVLNELTSSQNGLSSEEAVARLEKNGKNKLIEAKKDSLIKRFFMQMADPMTIILLVAASISAITASLVPGESFTDVFIIMFVVVLNATLGVIQESKAEKAIEALNEMTAATSRIIRDGKITEVRSEDLVVGDIVILEAGNSVPADARVLEAFQLKTEEAALTGESLPITKTADVIECQADKEITLGDRKNMVYMGSAVVYGRGLAVITATGMETEMGKIAEAISLAENEDTPLQKKLNQLSKILTIAVIGVCVFIFGFAIIKDLLAGTLSADTIGKTVLENFLIAISLAVAAIPEGLSAVVTIVLSIGVSKMASRNAIIRKLTAVETLGCTQIICSDKTGTLTQNKMTVTDFYGYDRRLTARAVALCSDAYLNDEKNAEGEPTEAALVNFAYKEGLDKTEISKEFERIGEAPFDSMRKMMSTVHTDADKFVQYTKGAPDEVLKKCTHILSNGEVIPLNDDIKAEIAFNNKAMADRALRVLSAAYKYYDEKPSSFEAADLENNLIFLGLTGMIDPIRPEVKNAVDECRLAGIRAVMITGDHINTAVAIAKELGVIKDSSNAITGAALEQMTDDELFENITKYSVYARVQPEHKVRIVKAWKRAGMITAMTGDGVNDAPSIKSADIGIGMGITGTDVTKNVADMILADDNFATIVAAVAEGRKIYDNTKKAIQFLLSSNLSEVISVFIATMFGFIILKPVHLLWINLITDSLPALALGMEKSEKHIMKHKPRPSNEGVFANGAGFDVCYQGLMVAVLTLVAYFIGHFMESGVWEITKSADGMTMAFLTMSMAEIFHSFNMRSQRGSIFTLSGHNFWLFGAMILSLILTAGVIFIPPIAALFQFETISLNEYLVAMGLAISVIPIVELVKLIQRTFKKNK